MKDLHSHILYGIDDGSKDLDVSLDILRDAYKNGVTDILVTPHYIEDSKFNCNNKEKMKILNKLKREMKKEKISVNLYLGNEVYINDNILNHIKNKEISTLNGSKYVLIELPMGRMYHNTKDIFFDLIRNGYVVVLAHPERYRYLQDNMGLVDEFIEMGVLLQGNYRSLFGYYGKDAKKTLKKLIKTHRITFIGSDIHRNDDFYMKKLEKKITKLTKNDDETKRILEDNFQCVIENKDIKRV